MSEEEEATRNGDEPFIAMQGALLHTNFTGLCYNSQRSCAVTISTR